jgi:hypothetical protein
MKDAAAAYGIFSISVSEQGEPVNVGNEGVINRDYLLFWKDRYFTSIVASDSSQESRKAMRTLAEIVGASIPAGSGTPEFIGCLPEEHLLQKKYVRGLLGLSSIYTFNTKDIFRSEEMVFGKYADHRTFIFRYTTEVPAREALNTVKNKLKQSQRFRNFGEQSGGFSVTDRENQRVYVTRCEKFLVVILGKQGTDIASIADQINHRIGEYQNKSKER